jgi:signal transduction histidine kinase
MDSRPPSDNPPDPIESVDERMVGAMRLLLSLSALLVTYIDPSEPHRLVAVTYATLALYSLYSGILYYGASAGRPVRLFVEAHWVDVGWYLVLIALSSGTNSVFFFFFFFAILVASFRRGLRAGLSVVVVSAVSFTLVGFATAPPVPHFEWNRFLLRPTYLLVLGYMMAYWGGSEIRLKQELHLLKEVSGLANPRFGLAHTLASVMRRLRAFYDAESCLLVWSEAGGEGHYLLTSERGAEGQAAHVEQIPAELASMLRSLPEDLSVVYKGRRTARYYTRRLRGSIPFTAHTPRGAEFRAESAALAARLEAESFITVPAYFRNSIVGRLYLTGRRGSFSEQDVEFLEQLIMQVAPVLDNIRLLERLAANAAEQERQRLARDIHDSVIQPYLGLQYRLAAIRNKLAAGAADVSEDLERLFESTAKEVSGLRGFVGGLRDADGQRDDLASAARRFATQFGEDYGLDVRVECRGRLNVNDRLAAEVIRFVHEGLSNVRKHTDAAHVTLSLGCDDRHCVIRIENDGAPAGGDASHSFEPRSLTERAGELGGRVRIEPAGEGRTAVTVEIPL